MLFIIRNIKQTSIILHFIFQIQTNQRPPKVKQWWLVLHKEGTSITDTTQQLLLLLQVS